MVLVTAATGYMNWAWEIRGALDHLAGGPGFRRGRRDPDRLRPGDALDFWRVEAVDPGLSLRLRADPLHVAIFRDLVRRVAERARNLAPPIAEGAPP
jgi:hypothetical protein